jgi:hypothetical protein
MLKAIIVALFLVGAMLAGSTDAFAFYCRATSATGAWGWGQSASLYRAERIALANCAIRTPRGYVCRLRRCVR